MAITVMPDAPLNAVNIDADMIAASTTPPVKLPKRDDSRLKNLFGAFELAITKPANENSGIATSDGMLDSLRNSIIIDVKGIDSFIYRNVVNSIITEKTGIPLINIIAEIINEITICYSSLIIFVNE